MEQERHSHPSFGQISFSRVQSTGMNFYGSELEQDHYISMELHTSEMERDLTCDRYYNKRFVARLRMTSGQFAEMITSMNRGCGVPCTFEFYDKEKTPELNTQESRKAFIHRKFEDRMKAFALRIKESQNKAKELVKKKTLSKQDVQDLMHHIEYLSTEVSSNIPFFARCFQETMDEVVFEAKTEVENAIQHKINVLGLQELHNQQNLLTNKKD